MTIGPTTRHSRRLDRRNRNRHNTELDPGELPMENLSFTLVGRQFRLSRERVEQVMEGVSPEPIHTHAVVINGVHYPVKQALEEVTGVDRADFISTAARRHFRRLGFEVVRQK